MKQLFVCLILLVDFGFGHSAWALWEKVGAAQPFTHYVDRGTIVRVGDLVKLWFLDDYKTAQLTVNKKTFVSVKQQFEFHCTEKKGRAREAVAMAGSMGRGAVVWSDATVEPWQDIVKGTMLADYWTVACGNESP